MINLGEKIYQKNQTKTKTTKKAQKNRTKTNKTTDGEIKTSFAKTD